MNITIRSRWIVLLLTALVVTLPQVGYAQLKPKSVITTPTGPVDAFTGAPVTTVPAPTPVVTGAPATTLPTTVAPTSGLKPKSVITTPTGPVDAFTGAPVTTVPSPTPVVTGAPATTLPTTGGATAIPGGRGLTGVVDDSGPPPPYVDPFAPSSTTSTTTATTTPTGGSGATTTAASTGSAAESEVCTNTEEAKRKAFSGTGKPGLLSEIYLFIKDVVGDASEKLFNTFTSNAVYQKAVNAAMILMVVIFGIGFTIGVIQPSFSQALIRLIKFGIIAAVISPGGWTFFSDYAVKFFMDGTDQLVKGVVAIGTGVTAPAGATPFYQLDQLAEFILQPETIIQLMGSVLSGGPYGMMMGGLMGIAVWGFFSLIVKALRLYAVTFVSRSLLLGVAPIFIVFLMFDRTKQMFLSWVNALISMSLQPILLFTFLSFFIVLIESASKDMLGAEMCWSEFAGVHGSVNKMAFWRFKDPETNRLMTAPFDWKGYTQCQSSGGESCPEFPINIVDILSFLLLVYLAQRFTDIIERIAGDLSNAFISLDSGGKIDQYLSQQSSSLFKKK